jgi:serine/threonine protein kinase
MNKLFLSNNYELLQKIGSGSFGEVYLTRDMKNNHFAAKVEEKKGKCRLKTEYNVYKKINKKSKVEGIPSIYNYIETEDYNILIMELLGPSLENKYDANDRKISVPTLLNLGLRMIEIIELFHSKGFIHRDIKPNNFLLNHKKPYNKLYLMDFGLSKSYLKSDGTHIDIKFERSLTGTARYCSLNVHYGIEPSRRDDLESICYVLIYLAKGQLPWQGLKTDKNKTQVDKIKDKKMATSPEKLCVSLPECFAPMLKYCRNLKFEEKPDYEYLKKLFIDEIKKTGLKIGFIWE